MENIKCKECNLFKEMDWSDGDLEQKIFGVKGHCQDMSNPDFNHFAKTFFGRGICKTDYFMGSPKWCAKRDNPIYVDVAKNKI